MATAYPAIWLMVENGVSSIQVELKQQRENVNVIRGEKLSLSWAVSASGVGRVIGIAYR